MTITVLPVDGDIYRKGNYFLQSFLNVGTMDKNGIMELRIQMKKMTVSGELLVFLGALFWSLNAPLIKFIELDALLTCGMRSVIAGLFLLPFLRLRKLNITPWLAVHLISHCCLCVSIVLALRQTSAAIAIGMQYGSIFWLFLVNVLLAMRKGGKEAAGKLLTANRIIPIVLIAVGVIVFMLSGLESSTMKGNLIALTESVSFALLTVSAKKSAGDNSLGLTALSNLFTGCFVFLFLSPQVSDVMTLGRQEWILILILGVIQVGLGYAFYNLGVNRTTPQKAAVIALWEMILGPVWVALFLQEYPGLLVCAGLVIIIAGIVLDARKN